MYLYKVQEGKNYYACIPVFTHKYYKKHWIQASVDKVSNVFKKTVWK